MTTMYIIGAILLLVEWYLIKHTYSTECRGRYSEEEAEDWKPVKMPVWVVILWIPLTALPYVGGIIGVIAFLIVYLKYACDPDSDYYNSRQYYTYWRIRNSFLLKQI